MEESSHILPRKSPKTIAKRKEQHAETEHRKREPGNPVLETNYWHAEIHSFAHNKMSSPANRLERLPTLVQEEIMVQLGTELSLKSLFRACPFMRSLFERYETRILRRILKSLIADDEKGNICRDVWTIISMPEARQCNLPSPTVQLITCRRSSALRSWPTHLPYLRMVHRLVSRIITFIEDFLSKATSKYPPRAYLGLPDLKWGTGSRFRGRRLDTRLLLFTSLTLSERYRLLRAFVRYELVCLIYRFVKPRSDARLDQHVKEFNDFNQGSNAPDLLTFYSAHDYYKSLYGAVFAHCGDAWLPDTTKGDNKLVFPDDLFFDAYEYFKDLNLGTQEQPRYLDELAGRGLDLLCNILGSMSKGRSWKHYFKGWLGDFINKSDNPRQWIIVQDGRQYDHPARNAQEGPFWDELYIRHPEAATTDFFSVIRLYSLYSREYLRSSQIPYMRQVQIYRQRAWGLFDNGRLYPKSHLHFPTVQQLLNLDTQLRGSHDRRQRRSQRWQDYWANRSSTQPDEMRAGIYASRLNSRFFYQRNDDRLPEIWFDN